MRTLKKCRALEKTVLGWTGWTSSPAKWGSHHLTEPPFKKLLNICSYFAAVDFFYLFSSNIKGLEKICLQVTDLLPNLKKLRGLLPEHGCLLLSPGNFWQNDREHFSADPDIIKTIHQHEPKTLQTSATPKGRTLWLSESVSCGIGCETLNSSTLWPFWLLLKKIRLKWNWLALCALQRSLWWQLFSPIRYRKVTWLTGKQSVMFLWCKNRILTPERQEILRVPKTVCLLGKKEPGGFQLTCLKHLLQSVLWKAGPLSSMHWSHSSQATGIVFEYCSEMSGDSECCHKVTAEDK